MNKFDYKAKMMSTQHIIDNLNELVDESNALFEQVDTYINEITYEILDDRMKYDIKQHLGNFYAQYFHMMTLVSDRLLVLKDDMISKMIIIPDGLNIQGIIVDYNRDFNHEMGELYQKLKYLEGLHSS